MFGLFSLIVPALGLLAVSPVRAANTADIVSGAAWTDTDGNVIQGHGAGILKVGQKRAFKPL